MGNDAVSGITLAGDVGPSPGSVFADFGRKNRGQDGAGARLSQLQVPRNPPQCEPQGQPLCPKSTRLGQRQNFSRCFPRKTKGAAVAAPAIPNF